MPTTYTATNAINLVETAVVNTLSGDAWLGSTTHVKTIHQRIRRTSDDPGELYLQTELPAIGVMVADGGEDQMETIGEFEISYRIGFDVWAAGADLDAADQIAKQIVARIRRLMRLQTFSPIVHSESTQLDGLLADGQIENEGFDFEYFNNAGWYLAHGMSYSVLEVLSTE